MTRGRLIASTTALLLIALWAVPIHRAIKFYGVAQEYLAATHTLDASNDVSFSIQLLVDYSISLCAGLIFAWLLSRPFTFSRGHSHKRKATLIVPFVMLVYAVVKVIIRRPEEVIVHWPGLIPLFHVFISLIALGLALRIIYKRSDKLC